MSKVNDFFKAISKDPEARKLLKDMKEPESPEEAAELYVGIAAKLGFSDITKESVAQFLAVKENVQKAVSAKAEADVKEVLDEDSLEAVSGGGDGCSSTFEPHEWCWFSDSCGVVINYYPGIAVDNSVQCTANQKVLEDESEWGKGSYKYSTAIYDDDGNLIDIERHEHTFEIPEFKDV